MRFVRLCAIALALLAIGGAAGRPAPNGPPAFAVAMLRRDGVLVPFAVYDGKKWSSPWPVPKYRLEAPIEFSDIPGSWWGRAAPATTWTAWPTGGQPRAVHVAGPVVFTAHCLSNIGLKTDYRSAEPIPPVTQQHHPKDGIATTGDVKVEAVEVLDDTAPEWSTILEVLKTDIEKAESKAATTDFWEQRYGWRTKRAKIPLKLEVLCRSKRAGPSKVVYYFEAVREIAPSLFGSWPGMKPDQMPALPQGRMWSGLTIFSQGFFELTGSTLVQDSIVSTFSTAGRTDVDYGLPLGIIGVGGHDHWIMHWSGYGHERYTILEVSDQGFKRVADVPGGAC
jgi:hypothetical protein